MPHPIIKTINCTGCHTYLVGCRDTRRALLVDPKVGQESVYRGLLENFDLKLIATLDTHTHADHLSASSRFQDEGVELWMSAKTECKREKRALTEGDVLEVGSLRLTVLEVPGHTPDSLALSGAGFVLTGDSLFIGGLARADFRGSNPELLFNSVKRKLMTLPDDTLVFPGHGYNDILFSTIGSERSLNEALQFESGAAYAASLESHEGAGNTPAVDTNLHLNLAKNPELPDSPSNVATCCAAPSSGTVRSNIAEADPEQARKRLAACAQASRWIDVREPFEFAHGHIPGTRSIPLSELGFHLDELRTAEPVAISCRSGVRSMTAARTLERLGVLPQPINLIGGILRWQDLGYEIVGEPAS